MDNEDVFVPTAFAENVSTIVEWFEALPLDSQIAEIEGRIGKFDVESSRFDSQVPAKWFAEKLAYFMAPGVRWDRVEDETTTSYLFEGGVRAVQRQDETAVFVQKVRKSTIDLRFADCPFDVRLAYSLEIPKPAPSTTACWVRMRQRKSFYAGAFRFDFSSIIEAKTQQEAQQKQEAKYEIEIEYVGNNLSDEQQSNGDKDRRENTKRSSKYLAMSMLFKLHDLVTPNGTDCSESARPIEILQIKQKKKQ